MYDGPHVGKPSLTGIATKVLGMHAPRPTCVIQPNCSNSKWLRSKQRTLRSDVSRCRFPHKHIVNTFATHRQSGCYANSDRPIRSLAACWICKPENSVRGPRRHTNHLNPRGPVDELGGPSFAKALCALLDRPTLHCSVRSIRNCRLSRSSFFVPSASLPRKQGNS